MAVMISIHAPREGCDFLHYVRKMTGEISIHAPREGCDHMSRRLFTSYSHFNPRTP